MKRKKRKIRVSVGIVVLLFCALLYHSKEATHSRSLTQSELVYSTSEELQMLLSVENKIARSARGLQEPIPVSSTASGYESICPEMKTGSETKEENSVINQNEKTVFLTFDDGPSRQTEKVLDILEQYQIKASFFVVSKDITETGMEAMKRAAENGHVIGMHSHSHEYKKIYGSVKALLEDYDKVFRLIEENTGEVPSIYRFPGGSYNSVGRSCIKKVITEMNRRGFTYFDWNVSAEDAVGTPTASSIKKNIFTNLESIHQPVILMHDGACNKLTTELLPEIIEELIKRGYEFDTLNHREACFFNW